MALAADMLDLAITMSNQKSSKLRDVRYRRIVSTAYYALFHLLVEACASKQASDPLLHTLISRTYSHNDMLKGVKKFIFAPPFTAKLQQSPLLERVYGPNFASNIPTEIQTVASAFSDLQQARHEADYNSGKPFSRSEMLGLVSTAKAAFEKWKLVSNDPAHLNVCELFLAALQVADRWKL